jgi:hypothetical protein
MHEKVKELLLGDKPCAIGKIGNVELMHFFGGYFADFGTEEFPFGGLLSINAGINCLDKTEFKRWIGNFAMGLYSLDVLLAWNKDERERDIIKYICSRYCSIVPSFSDIEPFNHGVEGWHYGLADKKVLVVSSFKDSIEAQIPNFSKIWNGAKLGSCEVIKCPQPFQITGEKETYFTENISRLTQEISAKDFDLCIIGAGGYSIPLCGVVKRLGKRSIHLGGATQVLFGIRGSRFDRNFSDQSWYGTEHFIKPLESDIPKHKHLVEEGCYW